MESNIFLDSALSVYVAIAAISPLVLISCVFLSFIADIKVTIMDLLCAGLLAFAVLYPVTLIHLGINGLPPVS